MEEEIDNMVNCSWCDRRERGRGGETDDHPDAPPEQYIPEIVRPPAPTPDALVADGVLGRVPALVVPLLDVGQGFEGETEEEEDEPYDVGAAAEGGVGGRVRVVGRGGHRGRVEDRHG